MPVPPKIDGIRAICFDLDDTLCAYWNASRAGLQAAWQAHLPDGISREAAIHAWNNAFVDFAPTIKSDWYAIYLPSGRTTRIELMRRALHRLQIEDDPRAEALAVAYNTARLAELILFPDAIEVLEHLSARYPLGLITNGPADTQREEIAALNIGPYFTSILIEGEMGFGKPEPAVFDRAERELGVESPDQVLMVGNSYRHDILPAIERGWRTIWIQRASDTPPTRDGIAVREVRGDGDPVPDATVGSLTEVLWRL